MSPEEKRVRKLLFGELSDGLKPIKPYRWLIDGNKDGLIEIPVSTMPIFKIPFHVSYILYISCFSTKLAILYFTLAMKLCQITHTSPSLLLHPLDFLGKEDVKELSFFPAMNLSFKKKISIVSKIIDMYSDCFSVIPLGEHARYLSNNKEINNIEPQFKFEANINI
jgi:hypothetical protein